MKYFCLLMFLFVTSQINALPTKNKESTTESSTEVTTTDSYDDYDETTSEKSEITKTYKNDDLKVEDAILLVISDPQNYDYEAIQVKKRKITKRETEPVRPKRAMIFRPLFVYRQQEIKRQRPTRKPTKKPIPCQCQFDKDSEKNFLRNIKKKVLKYLKMKYFAIAIVLLFVAQINALPTSNKEVTTTDASYDDDQETTTETLHIVGAEIIRIQKTFDNDTLEIEDVAIITTEDDDKDQVVKSVVKRETEAARPKRALVFRPLFVYRQQEIKRQKVKEERATRRTTKKPNSSG
ncbi:hypothetical protein PVAND_000891 [Polypedilum vanderplanki]|uniref:Uncharacterized protein n=1 Tax=Polypedilum vanderplanki TaxID=319348 RepID=A0A9J6BMG5_POLVA|nr:hypothetical protein PVAND_000891 [Polypedilum vanderplanki]